MKSKVIIWGAGGHAKVVADNIRAMGLEVIGFVDGISKERIGSDFYESKVLDSMHAFEIINSNSNICAFVGIGDNHARIKILADLISKNLRITNAIHPSAILSPSIKLGVGVAIMANVVIQADCIIEDGVILNTSCSVDHDCLIKRAVHIAPGTHLAGNVTVEEKSFIGIGSSIKDKISIGPNVIVGAGAVVVKDIQASQIVMGNPARS